MRNRYQVVETAPEEPESRLSREGGQESRHFVAIPRAFSNSSQGFRRFVHVVEAERALNAKPARRKRLRSLRQDNNAWRVLSHEYSRHRGVTAGFRNAKAHIVKELTELVQRIEANRVGAFPRSTIIQHHASLDAQATGDEIDCHVVHAYRRVAFEPHARGLLRRDEIAIDDVHEKSATWF